MGDRKLILLPEDFVDDAAKIGCEVEAIRAVAAVESSGSGFDPEGFPKTLFEGHVFSRLTKGVFDKSYPNLSYPKWTKQFYGATWKEEKARLNMACVLNRQAALMSASWGLFQIMGTNFATSGCVSIQEFVNTMCKDANSQMDLFTQFILHSGLADELRDKRWADFARIYNGPAYAVNKYDVKIAAAYDRLTKKV